MARGAQKLASDAASKAKDTTTHMGQAVTDGKLSHERDLPHRSIPGAKSGMKSVKNAAAEGCEQTKCAADKGPYIFLRDPGQVFSLFRQRPVVFSTQPTKSATRPRNSPRVQVEKARRLAMLSREV